jgi:hypothetical protein
MTDHLAAGRVRDAEIAIQEEVAQAASREFGIIRLDVGKFADDRVLIHLKPPPFFSRDRDDRRRPIFWQRGSARSKLHYAMRKSRQPRCSAANLGTAAAKAPKLLEPIQNSSWTNFRAGSPAQRRRSRQRSGWHQVKQSLPDA